MTPDTMTVQTNKVSVWNSLLASIISVITTLVIVSLYLGGAFQRLSNVEAKADKNEAQIERQADKLNEKLDSINNKFENLVNKQDFRELQKEFQDSVRKK